MKPCILPVLISIAIVSIAVGIFIFFKPALAIEIQRRFYEKINWRIEPISWPKEIRNTKIMGVFLIVAALFIVFYLFVYQRGHL